MSYRVYAVPIYGEEISWSGVSFWRLEGGQLRLTWERTGRSEHINVPRRYVGFYARYEAKHDLA